MSEIIDGDILIADTEANGLIIPGRDVQLATKMLCLGVKSLVSGEYRGYWGDDIPEGLERLSRARTIIGHNFVEYDRTLIQRLYGISLPLERIRDTLLASRFVGVPEHEYDIRHGKGRKGKISPHSLAALGLVLGVEKQDFDHKETEGVMPWDVPAELRQKLLEYLEQDVAVNAAAYEQRFRELWTKYPDAMSLETEILEPLTQQQVNGFCFDTEAAEETNREITAEVAELAKAFSGSLAPDVVAKKRIRAAKTKEIALAAPDPAVDHPGFPRVAVLDKGDWYQPIRFAPVSPGSPKQVVRAFKKLGWEPTVYTDSGAPALDKDVVPTIPLRQAGLLLEYRERAGLLAKLSGGEKSWLRHVVHGRLHGGVISIGANTHRMAHSTPNLAQVPTKGNVRRLFRASDGFVLVDADAVSIEARVMAHFLFKHDSGLYRQRVLNGDDVHTMNQKAINAVTRAIAKNLLYAYCYGSSPFGMGQQWVTAAVQAGEMEQPPGEAEIAEIGNFIKQQFDKTIPGLSKLIAEAKSEFKKTGCILAIDGRPLIPGSEISAFNTRIQGSAAILMKRALWFLHRWAKIQHYPIRYIANVHDEIIVETPPQHAEVVATAITDAIELAGEYYEMKCPMAGEAKIGPTWADVH